MLLISAAMGESEIQQMRTLTHSDLLEESRPILVKGFFHHHRMGKENFTSSDQPIDCIIVQKGKKTRVLIQEKHHKVQTEIQITIYLV